MQAYLVYLIISLHMIQYTSQYQTKIDDFSSLHQLKLNPNNRWIQLSFILPWDNLVIFRHEMMFKILILQRYYNLSDEQTEYQINDRMSFMRFLDLTIADDIPDSRTIWKFTEQITDLELTEPLFKRFEEELVKLNLIVNEGKIIDASFVEAPRQRNSKEENARIKKEGAAPKQWEESPEKLAQKDVDARWTKKNNQTYYGYKNHTKVDSESKLISNYLVTDASVHDSLKFIPRSSTRVLELKPSVPGSLLGL
jgi:IS5 family transposase